MHEWSLYTTATNARITHLTNNYIPTHGVNIGVIILIHSLKLTKAYRPIARYQKSKHHEKAAKVPEKPKKQGRC